MRGLPLGFLTLSLALASGCIVVDNRNPNPGPTPTNEPAVTLAGYPGYRVRANASASIPGGDIGYIVTANGQGGYRLTWTDTVASTAIFSGSVTVLGGIFDRTQTTTFSGQEAVDFTGDNQVVFQSIPTNAVHGIDMVTTADPIVVDAKIGDLNSGVRIYFTGAQTGLLSTSAYNPVAFSSP